MNMNMNMNMMYNTLQIVMVPVYQSSLTNDTPAIRILCIRAKKKPQ
jgi:hypothetical protein